MALSSALAAEPQVRHIPWDPDASIWSRLRDDDKVVVVDRSSAVDRVQPPFNDLSLWIDDRTCVSDVVAIGTLSSTFSFWTRPETWLNTRLDIVVSRLLFASPSYTGVKRIEVDTDGGRLKVRDITVEADAWLVERLKPGASVLVFAGRVDDALRSTEELMLISNGRLRVPWQVSQKHPAETILQNQRLDRIETLVRRARSSVNCAPARRQP